MDLIILGSGVAPVTGSRDFTTSISSGGGIAINGTPVNGELARWVGPGTIEGESDLTYDGNHLTFGGTEITLSTGALNIPAIPSWSGSEARVMMSEVTSGTTKVSASGGGTSNFLRADGTWTTPGLATAFNGLTYSVDAVVLGGDLSQNTTIDGDGSYSLAISNATDLELEASTSAILKHIAASNEKSVNLNGSTMLVTDTEDSRGLEYAGDYSSVGASLAGNRWIPDKGYVDGAISAALTAPSSGITVAKVEIGYGGLPDSADLATLPADSVIWDFKINITEAFNAPVPVISIGNSAHTFSYYFQSSTAMSLGWHSVLHSSLTLTNVEDKTSGSETISVEYADPAGTGSTGVAEIYMYYSTFS